MSDQCLVIARLWAGVNDKFPLFDKYATILDDNISPAIEADVLDWAKKNRPEVTKAKATRKAQIQKGIEWVKRHAVHRSDGLRNQRKKTANSNTLTCDDTTAEGLMSLLNWGILNNLSLARPMLVANTNEETAHHIAAVLPTRIERLGWGRLNIRLAVIPIAQVDRARLTILEADRQDAREGHNEPDHTKIHRPLLAEVDRILAFCNESSKTPNEDVEPFVDEQSATAIGADPATRRTPGPDRSGARKASTSAATRGLQIDGARLVATWNGTTVPINAATQLPTLRALQAANGAVVSHTDLHTAILPSSVSEAVAFNKVPREVRDAVSALRSALQGVSCPFVIKNVRGRGYQLFQSSK